jgi:hypothetical protein
MEEKFRARAIRRQILEVLYHMAAGAWLPLGILRDIMTRQGENLSLLDVRRHCRYLSDKEIGCIEDQEIKEGDVTTYSYRVTARGTRVVEGDESVPGIGDG